jgi:nucleoside-diphosphate-sugar epimerase
MNTGINHVTHRVLVTGGLGYLGSILCEHLLDAGFRVTALDNLMYGAGQQGLFHLCANPAFDFIKGDVRDEVVMRPALKEADVVVHLAGIVGAAACDRDPVLATTVNLDSVRLLNKLRSPNQLVIFPNTNSGYGATSGQTFCTEDTPLEPISLYGRTKVQAERVLLDSPNVVAFRLATVFGVSPRMRLDLLVNHFVHAAATDRYLVIFEKDFKRNFVHVRDVADCVLHSIANAPRMAGRVYNLGLDTANLSKAELALKVKQYVPDFYVHFAPIGQDPDKRNYVVSSARLREAGFEARRSLDDGIRELLKAYRMEGRGLFKNAA